jgi:hypothetical protein
LAKGETATETRCFISSLEKDALNKLNIIRKHWKIENNLHWQPTARKKDTKLTLYQRIYYSTEHLFSTCKECTEPFLSNQLWG